MFKKTIFNKIMKNGNKQTAEKLLFKSIKKIQKLNKKKNYKDVLKLSIVNSSPVVYLKKIQRKKKRSIEFPFLLSLKNRLSYGLKNIINCSNKINQNSFYHNFTLELLNSSKKISQSVSKQKNVHQESFIKKKFSNYRWF